MIKMRLTDAEIEEKLDNDWDGLDHPSLVKFVLEFVETEEQEYRQAVSQLLKMSHIACERIDGGLALGEKLDISPLRQAIFEVEKYE